MTSPAEVRLTHVEARVQQHDEEIDALRERTLEINNRTIELVTRADRIEKAVARVDDKLEAYDENSKVTELRKLRAQLRETKRFKRWMWGVAGMVLAPLLEHAVPAIWRALTGH